MSTGMIQIHGLNGRGLAFPVTRVASVRRPVFDEETILNAAAYGTSKICRYGGHVLGGTRWFWQALRPGSREENVPSGAIYSVCQHMIILSHVIEIVVARMPGLTMVDRWAHVRRSLVHDLPEGLGIMDMPHPVKHAIGPEYVRVEHDLEELVNECANLSGPMPAIVKEWDRRMCVTEARDLMGVRDAKDMAVGHMDAPMLALPLRIRPMDPWSAYLAWRKRLRQVMAMEPTPTAWNQVRFVLGLRYMYTGEELHGVWTGDDENAMMTGPVPVGAM